MCTLIMEFSLYLNKQNCCNCSKKHNSPHHNNIAISSSKQSVENIAFLTSINLNHNTNLVPQFSPFKYSKETQNMTFKPFFLWVKNQGLWVKEDLNSKYYCLMGLLSCAGDLCGVQGMYGTQLTSGNTKSISCNLSRAWCISHRGSLLSWN